MRLELGEDEIKKKWHWKDEGREGTYDGPIYNLNDTPLQLRKATVLAESS